MTTPTIAGMGLEFEEDDVLAMDGGSSSNAIAINGKSLQLTLTVECAHMHTHTRAHTHVNIHRRYNYLLIADDILLLPKNGYYI